MKKLLILPLLSLTLFASIHKEDRVQVEDTLSKLRDMLPLKVDSSTDWISSHSEKDTVVYLFKINEKDVSINEKQKVEIGNQLCRNSSAKILIEMGFDVESRYIDVNDKLHASVVVNKKICGYK